MDQLGVLTGPYTIKSMKPCDLNSSTRKEILEYFENSYSLNETLFTALKNKKAFYVCPDRLRLPLIFYYAHTATVYINKLILAGLITERVDMDFETLFETGVDEMSWDDTENYRMGGSFQWPSLKDVVTYRLKVRKIMRKVIEETPLKLPITMKSVWWAVLLGIEHERVHIETSSVLIRQLPLEMVTTPTGWKHAPINHGMGAGKNELITTKATEVTLGKPFDFPAFGWDNEYPTLSIKVPSFKATKYLITNKEFLEFVEDGGYKRKEFWSEEGWKWRCFRNAKHPSFWVCSSGCKSGCGGTLQGFTHCQASNIQHNGNGLNGNGHSNGYGYRTMTEVICLPGDWPVDVNYLEAKAYCAWKGPEFRLPSEAEMYVMRGAQISADAGVSCDPVFCNDFREKYNSDMIFNSSSPVNMFTASDSGFHDTFGNAWGWTEDNFNGYPGFQTHPYYDDFSDPSFDGFHNIIVGGSWASTGQQASWFNRASFRRHFFQHVGFRLVSSINTSDIPPIRVISSKVHILSVGSKENMCLLPYTHKNMFVPTANKQILNDTAGNLNKMLYKQYGVISNNYYGNLAEFVDGTMHDNNPLQSALVLGCATGRLAFHLSRTFSKVTGIDYSSRFLEAAIALKRDGTFEYSDNTHTKDNSSKTFDDSWSKKKVVVPFDIDRSRVLFKQLTWIPNELKDFDLVVLDFLDRVMNIED
ncbi:uncharacterized protein [Antedon mediterranea]|uniref:uncharacterized protein isoform X2 n=1 Tax=Antedon mediterranea TaxID=105859 RepID=UPI003AF7A38D